MTREPQEIENFGKLLIYEDEAVTVRVRLDGNTVWLPQSGIADLYSVTPQNVTLHIQSIYEEMELTESSTCKEYLQVQNEGTRIVQRKIKHYNLDMILAIGYRVRSTRGTQFRKWATSKLSELLVKGFVLDDERLKSGRSLDDDYFDELLERIRDIRASERLFYQKITDIYATSIDYDGDSESAKKFFATVQNKLHFAVHGQTAAELISKRVDAQKPHLGLSTWKNAPKGAIRKTDIEIAKNYLTSDELLELNRIVTMYLDYAQDQARRHNQMRMADWEKKLNDFLKFNERDILENPGKISHELAIKLAREEFDKYDKSRMVQFDRQESDFDRMVKDVKSLDAVLPKRKNPLKTQTKVPKNSKINGKTKKSVNGK